MKEYWEQKFRTEIIPILLSGTTRTYDLQNATSRLENASKIVGVSHRQPADGAYTQDANNTNRLLIDATIFNAARLVIKNIDGAEELIVPFSTIGERSGGDNFFLRLPENFEADFRYGKSKVTLHCTDGIITTASNANQCIELVIWYIDEC
jgi:hypothetical protein